MTFVHAQLLIGDPDKPTTTIPVDFNPASLRITTSNQFDDSSPNQVSKPTTFKLDVELLFDSTADGQDIVEKTKAIRSAATADASGAKAKDKKGKAKDKAGDTSSNINKVTFTWGTLKLTGFIESLNETLDYWSSDGVPLRSTIQISLKSGPDTFLSNKDPKQHAAFVDASFLPDLPEIVSTSVAGDRDIRSIASAAAGNAASARFLAALNGSESIRGGAGAMAGAGFAVGGGAQLQAAAGFALSGGISAGVSLGFGIGASAGLSAGAGLGASVGVGMAAGVGGGIGGGVGLGIGGGIGIGAGASAGIGIGASAGIGIGATAGAGAGFGMSGAGITSFSGTRMTGLDGVTRTSGSFGSASAGMTASGGAFAGLGTSRTSLPGAGFNADLLLPPPLPGGGVTTTYDISGRATSGGGQVAASYAEHSSVTVW